MSNQNPNPNNNFIDNKAHLLYKVMEKIKWDKEQFPSIISKLKNLENGIPAESEFIALLLLLGKCEYAHKLEQKLYTSIQKPYRIPDLMALFEYHSGNIPVAIEVKSVLITPARQYEGFADAGTISALALLRGSRAGRCGTRARSGYEPPKT